jgi:hypothetical protein
MEFVLVFLLRLFILWIVVGIGVTYAVFVLFGYKLDRSDLLFIPACVFFFPILLSLVVKKVERNTGAEQVKKMAQIACSPDLLLASTARAVHMQHAFELLCRQVATSELKQKADELCALYRVKFDYSDPAPSDTEQEVEKAVALMHDAIYSN